MLSLIFHLLIPLPYTQNKQGTSIPLPEAIFTALTCNKQILQRPHHLTRQNLKTGQNFLIENLHIINNIYPNRKTFNLQHLNSCSFLNIKGMRLKLLITDGSL